MSTFVVPNSGRVSAYGAEELKRVAHRYAFFALGISIFIHFSILGSYYIGEMFKADQRMPDIPPYRGPVVVDRSPIIPGTYTLPTPPGPATPKISKTGMPVAVPNDPVTIEKTISSQQELVKLVDPRTVDGSAGEAGGTIDFPIDDNMPPDPWVPVEKEPVIVTAIAPVYPPLALKAGLEGNVYVRIWVDRQGKVRQVEILKSDYEIFNEAALAAAKQFVFTPAYMNSGPVPVWVGVPFMFKLVGAN